MKQIASYIENQNVIEHNGFGFYFPVLDKTLDYYNIPIPTTINYLPIKNYKKNLANLCKEHNIPLHHHDALSDARACAKLYLRCLNV
jgi:DNA polymerase-3 subunit epsilon